MKRGLRTRLVLTHVGVACLAIALVAVIVAVAGERRFARYATTAQEQITATLLDEVASTYEEGAAWSTADIATLNRLANRNGARLAVYDPDGELRFVAGGGGHGRMRMGGGMGSGVQSTRDGEIATPEGWSTQSVPITVAGQQVGTAVVHQPQAASLPLNSAYRSDLLLYIALAGVAAGIVSLGVGVWVSRRIISPIKRLSAAADAVAHGHREVSVEASGSDEVAELATSFNLMSASLARQEQWRRTMTSDLAHELRTPLATIQARVEALEDGALPATPANLRIIGEEVERLGRLLSQLRRLDELDASESELLLVPLDLAQLAQEVADAASEAFRRDGITLTIEAHEAIAFADADRMRQVLVNLLDNARKFTCSGGHVRLEVHPGVVDGAPVVEVVVADDGPGVDAADLPHVFERFFRGRSAGTAEGAGLGLAIVRGLIEAQGGTVEIGSTPGVGTTVTTRLPAP